MGQTPRYSARGSEPDVEMGTARFLAFPCVCSVGSFSALDSNHSPLPGGSRG